MKRKRNKDGSVVLIFTKAEFDNQFIVGCLEEYPPFNKPHGKVVIRVVGEVPTLKYCVVRKSIRSSHETD